MILILLASSFLASSCNAFPKAIYVPDGVAVEIRREVWLPVWVHRADGTKYAGKVLADQSWQAGRK